MNNFFWEIKDRNNSNPRPTPTLSRDILKLDFFDILIGLALTCNNFLMRFRRRFNIAL